MTKANGSWLISAGTVGKGKNIAGVSVRSAQRNAAVCWQLHGAPDAVPAVQSKLVWNGVLAALVGDV